MRLWIGGIPPVDVSSLEKRFASFGCVTDAEIKKNDAGGLFAFLTLQTDDAATCIKTFHGTKWMGHVLSVAPASEHYLQRLKQERDAPFLAWRKTDWTCARESNPIRLDLFYLRTEKDVKRLLRCDGIKPAKPKSHIFFSEDDSGNCASKKRSSSTREEASRSKQQPTKKARLVEYSQPDSPVHEPLVAEEPVAPKVFLVISPNGGPASPLAIRPHQQQTSARKPRWKPEQKMQRMLRASE
eukprot:gnl/Hemi2/14856_TR5041_c0_g2_i1.p1 gnl/Hemi2/14856_TR5041_c0_g2~~gnl/Hemi2/14856_TR5041_c0_g2_i1.p1  ORF type:complete len:255 (-),score=10.32 gnl/Hemi2/14856_TR5041_c0_g2_i1:40-762(-)